MQTVQVSRPDQRTSVDENVVLSAMAMVMSCTIEGVKDSWILGAEP